ncbi:MAG: hypothetical protein IKE94_15895 [Aeriscardovia sp.]|nr:hypothetical protein [Aeriscardovia sp.]
MRLIEADAIYKILESCEIKKDTYGSLLNDWDHGYNCGIERAESEIECAPTVDAVPVRHGHWIDIDSETYTWAIRCNKCGHERSMMSTQKTYPTYCEKCGARMDGEEE